ncbi:MAG: porin [Planctomycetota bacterium]|jgi:phosphate-selective porin
MHMRTVSMTAAAAGTLVLAAPLHAGDDDDLIRKLQSEVESLRTEVADLRAADEDEWLTEQRAEEIRGIVNDVLADADTRASLLGSGITAGWDKGFFLASEDGNFKLKMAGQIQFRFVWNERDGTLGASDDDDRYGFETRRTKLKFSGHVIDPSWQYAINGAFDRGKDDGEDGDFRLEDAFVKKKFGNGMYLKWGQYKAPYMREELVSSSRQLAVDRSGFNEFLNQDRTQGIELGFEGDSMRGGVMINDGFRADNLPFAAFDSDFAVVGRLEFLGAGSWKQFKDFTAWEGEDTAWMVGVAAHWEEGEDGNVQPTPPPGSLPSRPLGLLDEEYYGITADFSLEMGGPNLFAAFTYESFDNADVDLWGFVVQGGIYLVPDEWELFARYDYIDIGDLIPTGEDYEVITVGVNRYWAKHALKWTTDVQFGLEEIDGRVDSSGIGTLTDAPGEDGQIVIRSQFQLLF